MQFHTGEYFAKKMIGWGADPDKLCILQNGVDVSVFSGNFADGEFFDVGVPVLLTARRLVKKNGVEYLLAAMSLVIRHIGCMLVVVGDGDERAHLEELAREFGISDNVMFTGAVPHEKISCYIAACTMAVVPSIMEASSRFMLEAMGMGKPVVASNVGGIPEVINDDCGVLVEPMDVPKMADAIIRLLEDENLRMHIGGNARRRGEERFTSYQVAERVLEGYCCCRE